MLSALAQGVALLSCFVIPSDFVIRASSFIPFRDRLAHVAIGRTNLLCRLQAGPLFAQLRLPRPLARLRPAATRPASLRPPISDPQFFAPRLLNNRAQTA